MMYISWKQYLKMEFQTIFDQLFIKTQNELDRLESKVIGDIYNSINNTGKLKFFAYMRDVLGIQRNNGNKYYLAIKVKPAIVTQEVKPAVVTQEVKPAVVTQEVKPAVVTQMSLFELESLKLKKLKMEQLEKLKQMELEKQEKLKQMELEKQEKLKQMEIEQQNKLLLQQEKLKQMELEQQERLNMMELKHKQHRLEVEVEEKDKDRQFIREENNKNRCMYSKVRSNQYLDMQVYGTPSNQYIKSDNMIKLINYKTYDAINSYHPVVDNNIKELVNDFSKDTIIYEDTKSETFKTINVSDINKLVEKIIETNKPIFGEETVLVNNTLQKVVHESKEIPFIASRDQNRYLDSTYTKKLNNQNHVKNKSKQPKYNYVKPVNKLKMLKDNEFSNEFSIECYCCSNKINLNDSGCHRSHNIPQSSSGDWSKDNIYLCCATCNSSMSDQLTVEEYKVNLFVKIYEN